MTHMPTARPRKDAVGDVGRLGLEFLGDAQPTTTTLGPCGDAVVMTVGQTPTVMTHKPTARPGRRRREMLVELRLECLLGDVTT